MKRALVCGAGGFIGGHLVKKLEKEGVWVRGVDIKEHEFALTQVDEFLLLDLRKEENCQAVLSMRVVLTRCINWQRIWVGWGSSIRPNAKLCITAP